MRDFSLHHKTVAVPPGFTPRGGDLVSAKFSDGQWYRAKVRRASPIKKEAEVTFIDYGNQDTVSFSDIRPLDPKFRSLPGQAHEARLRCVIYSFMSYAFSETLCYFSFVKLVGSESEYHDEAVDRFRALCEGRKLIANIDQKEGPLHHLRLFDPSDSAAAGGDPYASINTDLVREGFATVDKKGCKYLSAYPGMVKKLRESITIAKRDRAGMFEFGDVEEDD